MKPTLSDMTLREKIGQCMCFSQYFITQKVEVNENLGRTHEEQKEILEKNPCGAFWCHSEQKLRDPAMDEYNWGKHKATSDEYKEWIQRVDGYLPNIHLLRACDAELMGPGSVFPDLTVTNGGLAVGAANSEELSFKLGVQIAKELKMAGVNWRWAPVCDVRSRYSMSVMRPFSSDLDDMIKFSVAHIKGMQSENVAGTAKHFPGGDIYEYRDSHFSPSMIFAEFDEWKETQGKVFQGVIDGGVYSVMTDHGAFPAADNTKINGKYIPSTLSKKIVTDLLKNEMGFKGVVITDAVNMAGLTAFYDREELYVKLLEAGNDMLLGTQIDAIDIVEKAVLEGRLSEGRINDAVNRVLDMKEKLGMFEDGYVVGEDFDEKVLQKTIEVNKKIAEKSVTLVKDENNLIPVDKNKIKKVTIIVSTHTEIFTENVEKYMKKAFEDRGALVSVQRRINSAEIKKIAEESDLLVYAAFIAPHQPKGFMSFYDKEVDTFMAAFTKGNEKSVGVSMGYPFIHFDIMGNADTFINTYVATPDTMEAFVKAIYGEIKIEGKSPVKLYPPSWPRW